MKKLLTFHFITLTISLFAQDYEKSIKHLLDEQYPAEGPGGAILVAKGGNIIHEGRFGKANIEAGTNNAVTNNYKIGSITKQFTSVAILMLQEQGKLSVDDKITKHLSDYPEPNITLRQLLNHTAGLPNYTNMPSWFSTANESKTVDEMLAFFKDEPLDFKPGTDWSYSNSGYIVLGAVIEKVSGISYEEFIEKNIFNKIGMNHTYYGRDDEKIAELAIGYSKKVGGTFEKAMEMSLTQPYAAGSIISTVGDQFIWIKAIRDNKLISEESKKSAWTSAILPNGKNTHYGFGWMQNEIAGYQSIEHGGSIFGFVCSGVYIPEQDIFVSILSNRDGVSPDEIAVRIAAAVAGHPYVIGATIPLTKQEMEEYVAVYDFEDGSTRTITTDGENLYSQKSGSVKLKIIPVAKDEFVFEGYEMSTIKFKRNNMNRIGGAVAKFRVDEISGKRTNKEIVERVEIKLAKDQLERLQGEYQLAPEFTIKVSVRDDKLIAQATGQPEFELFATSPLNFFLKVVDAQIDFVEGETGEIESMILHQGRQDMPGMKL